MPVDRTRQRYNAKARQSTVGGSSHQKKGKRKPQDSTNQDASEPDPNAEIVVLKSEEQKDLDRREKLREEVCFTLFCSVRLNRSPALFL